MAETYFVMPVRLCVNEVELFEQPGMSRQHIFITYPAKIVQRVEVPNKECQWLSLPLLGFATQALRVIREIKPGEERIINLAVGGHLVITCQGDQLFIICSISKHGANADHSEVFSEFLSFSKKVRELLLNRIPAMQQHPAWIQWL